MVRFVIKSALYCAVAFVAMTAFLSPVCAESAPVELEVSVKGTPRSAHSGLLGHNIPASDWHGFSGKGQPFLFDPESRQFLKSWEPLTHAFPLRVMRYHCGNKYPWKNTVGNVSGRKQVDHDQWKGKYRTEAGLDEFLQWIETLPQPSEASLIASPLRPVQEIADLVAYCNSTSGPMAEWRAANGHPKPYNIRYWELGNEVDWTGREDLNVMRDDTPPEKKNRLRVSEYVRECKLRIDAMRQVDPTIKIYAHAKTAPWFVSNPNWPEWHQAVLREIGGDIDGIVIHPYYDGYPVPMVLRSVDKIITDIRELGPKDRQLSVWVSEHSRWVNYEKLDERPQSWGLQGAISAGDFLISLFERPEVSLANYWCYAHRGPWRVLNANWEGDGQQKFGTGAFWLYLLMNRAYAPEVQSLRVDHSRWQQNPEGYSYTVSAMLFRDPATGRKSIVAVNRSSEQSFDLMLPTSLISSGRVTRIVLTAESLKSTNIPATPDAVKLGADETVNIETKSSRAILQIPAKSVTAWLWP